MNTHPKNLDDFSINPDLDLAGKQFTKTLLE